MYILGLVIDNISARPILAFEKDSAGIKTISILYRISVADKAVAGLHLHVLCYQPYMK